MYVHLVSSPSFSSPHKLIQISLLGCRSGVKPLWLLDNVGREGTIADSGLIATTATSLGFDFIPNPSILVLPDHPDQPPHPTTKPGISPTSLGVLPGTPALIPTRVEEQDAEDDEDDDWEHISEAGQKSDRGEKCQTEEEDGEEGDMIFLGELELEECVDEHNGPKKEHLIKMKGGKSYAAAVGTMKVQ